MEITNQIWAQIDLNALIGNYKYIKSCIGNSVPISVIKADAYGHGAIPVCKELRQAGAEFFAVSCLREALELRHKGIDCKVLILGYTDPGNAEILAQNNISQAVYSSDYARELAENLNGIKLNVHIKLNTGMNRIGFDCCSEDVIKDIENALRIDGINFEGIFTHFAAADRSGDESGEFTKLQYERFIKVCDGLKKDNFVPKLRHCCNSAATLLEPLMHLDAVRPGIIIYGLTPDTGLSLPKELKPVLSFKATVSMIHKIKKGNSVSYSRTFKAPRDMVLATVTAGYADGYPRFLSNCGRVIINGEYCPIVGKVCMDQTVVDVTNLKNVRRGDEVVLMGSSGDKSVTAEEIAALGGTINYEIVCGISRRVPRIYIKDKKTLYTSDYLENTK